MFFDRRRFLATLSAALCAPVALAQGKTIVSEPKLSRAEVERRLRPHLVTKDEPLFQFAVDVYHLCVFGRLMPPTPPLNYAWLVPGGGYYAQWLWDTMFVADLLSVFPEEKKTIRGVFQNYWDFQKRWDDAQPAYRHGMIANFIAPFQGNQDRDGRQWRTFPAYSQAPLLAWGMERVYRRNADHELLDTGLKPLEEFHEWYWRERDVRDQGVVSVGSYSGDVQHARYETYDREVDLDDLHLTPYPGRADSGAWYGDLCIPANTAYLLLAEQSLARMARIQGDLAMAKRREERYRRGVASMRKLMWDESAGCFLAVHRETLQKVNVATVGSFVPLMAGIPTAAQSAAMSAKLNSPDWATPLPVPTVMRSDKRFQSGEFWRGDTWPVPTYQVCAGLASYGHRKQAGAIADKAIANAMRQGISERYDSLTGAPLGVPNLGMSGALLLMAMDGVSAQYKVRTR